jgi:hypothetical protein
MQQGDLKKAFHYLLMTTSPPYSFVLPEIPPPFSTWRGGVGSVDTKIAKW